MSALPPGRVWFGTWRAQMLTSISGPDAKTFALMSQYRGERADLAISLDVIYHLVEDRVFEDYMRTLVGSAHRSDLVVACSHALAEEVKRFSPAANVVAVWERGDGESRFSSGPAGRRAFTAGPSGNRGLT